MQAVGFVLEPVDLHRVRRQALAARSAPRARLRISTVDAETMRASSRAPNRTAFDRYSRMTAAHASIASITSSSDRGERVDVFAVDRRDERAVEALDDLVREEVALVLDFLDLVGLVPDRVVGRDHLFEQAGALLQLVGHGQEVGVELFFSGNQTEGHAGGIVADPFTRTLHLPHAGIARRRRRMIRRGGRTENLGEDRRQGISPHLVARGGQVKSVDGHAADQSAGLFREPVVYQEGGSNNSALFNIGLGTVAFVAAQVAKTGDMKIETPTATMGIRGTSGLVEVPQGATPGSTGQVAIKLYPDADGRVGRIEVFGRDGGSLGVLSRGATGFAIRPGLVGGAQRFTAAPLQISPQQAERDRGFVRQTSRRRPSADRSIPSGATCRQICSRTCSAEVCRRTCSGLTSHCPISNAQLNSAQRQPQRCGPASNSQISSRPSAAARLVASAGNPERRPATHAGIAAPPGQPADRSGQAPLQQRPALQTPPGAPRLPAAQRLPGLPKPAGLPKLPGAQKKPGVKPPAKKKLPGQNQ